MGVPLHRAQWGPVKGRSPAPVAGDMGPGMARGAARSRRDPTNLRELETVAC